MKACKKNCLFCLKEFEGDYRKKFCNHTCAGFFNSKKIYSRTYDCEKCNKSFLLKRKAVGGFCPKKFCEPCSLEVLFENQTKGSLYGRRKNWQSANSTLRKHSRRVYTTSGQPQKCKICGYDKHIEISHIKSVKDYPDDAKVLEINSINNLVGLCPNHHWEFDNGRLNNLNEQI